MKTIQIEDDLYQYIASKTENIGESASSILRRLLIEQQGQLQVVTQELKPLEQVNESEPEVVESEEPTSENISAVCDNTSVFNILNKEEVATQKGAVGRFLFILGALHRCHIDNFNNVLDVKGRERNYFATSEKDLEASGSSIKPKQIPESSFWVVTNNNTPRKKLILTEVAYALGYSADQAEQLRELI